MELVPVQINWFQLKPVGNLNEFVWSKFKPVFESRFAEIQYKGRLAYYYTQDDYLISILMKLNGAGTIKLSCFIINIKFSGTDSKSYSGSKSELSPNN